MNDDDEVIKIIKNKHENDVGIIYCPTKSECDSLAEVLKENGFDALPYHSDLSEQSRISHEKSWIDEKVRIHFKINICNNNNFLFLDKNYMRHKLFWFGYR